MARDGEGMANGKSLSRLSCEDSVVAAEEKLSGETSWDARFSWATWNGL